MTFRVGQKVVCVDASLWPELAEGSVYEVETTVFLLAQDAVFLVGIRCSRIPETPCFAYRFRPIVERKTDISIFTKMLTPEGVDA